ncbi:glycosyltransferase family 25 protein [Vibrio sp. M250220]|uniref:glycosyltransferase family 25 protein n=1 Tax=Vibrio sp. M250220 TaxID=3020894 RepID=UPI002F4074C8
MIKTFIIHVSKGYEERRKHIDTHLPSRGINEYEYMLRGDIDDLSTDVINVFFGNALTLPEKSCFYKHYLVMKKVVEECIPQVLVLEDDAFLRKDFCEQVELIQHEIAFNNEKNYLINIEEASSLVPFSIRNRNQKLYLSDINKLTGGLIYDYEFAKNVIEHMSSTTQNLPIDTTLGQLRSELRYNLFWVHPPLVCQGSKNGQFDSELSGRTSGLKTRIRGFFKDYYKMHILSNLRLSHLKHFKNIIKY